MSTVLATLTREGFNCPINVDDDGKVWFIADADIDADGSRHAYHPDGRSGTDFLQNAKDQNGKWVGILTDRMGVPLIQGPDDLAPGYYISSTAYEYADQPPRTQRRYVNGEEIPFCVVPPIVVSGVPGIVKGARCKMTNLDNKMTCEGIVGDVGPRTKAGEVSPAAAKLLGLNSSPKYGGTDEPIIKYEIWPGVPGLIAGKPIPLMRTVA